MKGLCHSPLFCVCVCMCVCVCVCAAIGSLNDPLAGILSISRKRFLTSFLGFGNYVWVSFSTTSIGEIVLSFIHSFIQTCVEHLLFTSTVNSAEIGLMLIFNYRKRHNVYISYTKQG